MRPAIWLLVILIFTIAVSLVFAQYISYLHKEPPEKEGLFSGFDFIKKVNPVVAAIDRRILNSCNNKMNDKSKKYSDTNATWSEKSVCKGALFQHYPSSDDTVKRWSKSKTEQINNAFERAGVDFVTTEDDVDFLLNFFKDPKNYNFDILTYPYDNNMNKFYELVQNMKKANVTSFKQYLEENNQVTLKTEGYSGMMTNIGCYNDKPDKIKGDRALTKYMGYVTDDAAGSAASKCADKAAASNSRVFGLQWRNGNNMQCFVGDGKDDEIAKAKAYGVSTSDCTKNQVPFQNNVFILPPGNQKYTKQQTFDLYGAREDIQKKFGIDPSDYSKILAKKAEIDAALQPKTEGLEVMASNESDKTKYVGVSNRERGGASTWNTFNVSDKNLGKEAVDGCKKICDSNSKCGAFVVQKRAGPWDCWTIPKASLSNPALSAKKENAAQATYYKTDNIVCANGAKCGFAEPFQENFSYGPVMSNKDFPGNDIGGPTKVKTADECKTRCDGVSNCKGFVLDKRVNPNNCWLKSVVPPNTGLPGINNIDTYSVIPGVASSAAKVGSVPLSSKSVAEVSTQKPSVTIPETKVLNPLDFNKAVSSINDDIQITTSISTLLNGLQENGVSLQGFTTREGFSQVQIVADSAVRMSANKDTEVLEIVAEINNRYGDPDKTIAILAELGVKYDSMSNELNILSNFGINSGDSLSQYFDAAKGPLQQIGIRPLFVVIDAMNNYKLTYADVMDSSFVSKMQGLGFNANSDFAGILTAMVNFKITSTRLPNFRTISGMQNINELPDYTSAMTAFGIPAYNANHDDIVKVARAFKNDFPDATRVPSLVHTQKVLKLLTDAELTNYTTYASFRTTMSKKFNPYDDGEFRVSLTQFGTFKNRGSDNKGRLRRSEIDRIVNSLSSCGYFNSSNKVSFSELINSLARQNMRLYVAGDQKDRFMVFDTDACSFMKNFNGNQSNFGKDKEGFTGEIQGFMKGIFKPSPESFTNAYSIAKNFGIANPVQAVAHADNPAKFYSEPDFYSKINSFGIDSVSKYDNLVKVFKKFGSDNTTFCKVVEKLKVFGVPSREYVSFVEALTKINVTYPFFYDFIDRIMDFGVIYQPNVKPAQNLYYRFLNSVNAFGLAFTTPDAKGNNMFYRFLAYMKSVGLAVGYPNTPYPCNGLKHPSEAFFNAIKTFIKLGYTIETFFEETDGKVSTKQMLDIIRKYDCQLLDFSTPKLSDLLGKEPIVKMANNMGVPDNDKYFKYYSGIFIGKVPNKFPIIPNDVFSFMTDENYRIKETLLHDYYSNIAKRINEHINKTYMDGAKVKNDKKNEYERYMLNMNTLRLFPNFVAAFIKDVYTNTQNPYNAIFSSESQDINPNKQRGCTRYMKISLNEEQMRQCPT